MDHPHVEFATFPRLIAKMGDPSPQQPGLNDATPPSLVTIRRITIIREQ